ncbi:hypothetical protein D7Y09_14380 [bacterium 1XD42-1]|nr:hypothetical protein D7X25_16515 [bacterium 1XD42-8]RKJ62190.1 hypothetical protein D7Y09_14380 [bacterium 1XD42-1]
MEQEILTILHEIAPYIDIDANSKLIEDDILDSMGILVLVTELEEKYKITIPLEKIKIEDFQTVSTLVSFVKGYTKVSEK